jgi:hypothetical protein
MKFKIIAIITSVAFNIVAFATAITFIVVSSPASARPSVTDIPPECHTIQLVAPDNQIAWVTGCGGAAGQESPWQDYLRYTSREPVVMDGVTSISPANCPKSNPCVILAENAPRS